MMYKTSFDYSYQAPVARQKLASSRSEHWRQPRGSASSKPTSGRLALLGSTSGLSVIRLQHRYVRVGDWTPKWDRSGLLKIDSDGSSVTFHLEHKESYC